MDHDMQKAFDKVDLFVLFKKLHLKLFPAIYFILCSLYTRLSLRVLVWYCSDSSVLLNSVKQGGIWSLFLFDVFIDLIYC